jgi:putative Mn2+ efflux pump MntP
MSFGTILFLAIGLAMDATAVAAAKGMAAPVLHARDIARVALLFGAFQALMPMLGWLVGRSLGPMVEAWDHWIAFTLLCAIGGKMLWEARHAFSDAELAEAPREGNLFGLHSLVILATATSVDAFAVGITLPMLNAPLVISWLTIGVTTAVLSALGIMLGRRLGALLGRYLDAVGGFVLIGLGVKILVEHVTAA